MTTAETAAIELPELPDEQGAQVNAALTIVQRAEVVEIIDPASQAIARDIVRQINERIKFAKDHHRPMKETTRAAWQAAVDAEKRVLEPLERAKVIITATNTEYERQQEIIAQKERLKAEQEAARERERRIKAAEKKLEKLMAGAGDDAAKVNELRATLEKEETTEEEAHLIRNQIAVLDAKIAGMQDKAERIEREATASMMAPPVAAPTPARQKVAGTVKSKNLVVVVTDPMALIKAIAEGKVPVGVIKAWDEKGTLKNLAKAGMELPGCDVKEDISSHFR